MKVFSSASAQAENLGDMVLRRTMVEWLADKNIELHLFVGKMPLGYVTGLVKQVELDRIVLYRSHFAWLCQLLTSAVSGSVSLVFAPGQQALLLRRSDIAHALVNLILALVVRAFRGNVLKIGRSFHGKQKCMVLLERALHRSCQLYVTRDGTSGKILGRHVRACADIAVGATSPNLSPTRDIAAVSLRHDRPVPERLLSAYIQAAGSAALRPVLVSQVHYDNCVHAGLAQRFGIEHIEWNDEDHVDQLQKVLDIYSKSAVILSNRLHALIFAINCGAIPLGYSGRIDEKISSHLSVLGMERFVVGDVCADSLAEVLDLRSLSSAKAETDAMMARGRSDLIKLRNEVISTCLRQSRGTRLEV